LQSFDKKAFARVALFFWAVARTMPQKFPGATPLMSIDREKLRRIITNAKPDFFRVIDL
jgi:hypothetical protein